VIPAATLKDDSQLLLRLRSSNCRSLPRLAKRILALPQSLYGRRIACRATEAVALQLFSSLSPVTKNAMARSGGDVIGGRRD